MNARSLQNTARLAALLLIIPTAQAAELPIRFDSLPGGKVRIEGTSSIHDWQVEGSLIGGRLEAGPGFPSEPGQVVAPGKVDAKVDVFIPVRSLKSVEKDGRPYSDSMDDIMYGKLLQPTYPRILYHLDELILKERQPGRRRTLRFRGQRRTRGRGRDQQDHPCPFRSPRLATRN